MQDLRMHGDITTSSSTLRTFHQKLRHQEP